MTTFLTWGSRGHFSKVEKIFCSKKVKFDTCCTSFWRARWSLSNELPTASQLLLLFSKKPKIFFKLWFGTLPHVWNVASGQTKISFDSKKKSRKSFVDFSSPFSRSRRALENALLKMLQLLLLFFLEPKEISISTRQRSKHESFRGNVPNHELEKYFSL